MTHTPGPWAYDADSKEVFSSDEGHGCGWIASVDGNDSNGCPLPESMRLANARLIAAAPELLAALKAHIPWREEPPQGWGMWADAVAAINKAEGIGINSWEDEDEGRSE